VTFCEVSFCEVRFCRGTEYTCVASKDTSVASVDNCFCSVDTWVATVDICFDSVASVNIFVGCLE
jgi:hypothetical protein